MHWELANSRLGLQGDQEKDLIGLDGRMGVRMVKRGNMAVSHYLLHEATCLLGSLTSVLFSLYLPCISVGSLSS